MVTAINKVSKELSEGIKTGVKAPDILIKPNQDLSGVISFLPAIFFVAIIWVLLSKAGKSSISLREILFDKDLQATIIKEEAKVGVANAHAMEARAKTSMARAQAFQLAGVVPLQEMDPPPLDDTEKPSIEPQSVSRLIVLMSGVTTLSLVVCITTFYMHRYSLGDKEPDLGNLSTVLYGLGLGIVPYGFNKIASALRS